VGYALREMATKNSLYDEWAWKESGLEGIWGNSFRKYRFS
jgi:hypothetical protein